MQALKGQDCSMAKSEFDQLPLHDALLESAEAKWAEKTIQLRLAVFTDSTKEAAPHVLSFLGVTSFIMQHKEAWGPSNSVLSASYSCGIYRLEMQSGDCIEVEADSFDLASL
tara:strand:+ start:994 stop:1329 length:336 start_codon:yes stop_codon:yes gene_type:complete